LPLNPMLVRQQIENLKVLHVDLFDDEEAWLLSLESETDMNDLLTQIIRRIEDSKALVVGMKDRFEELKARKERFERRIESLRDLAFKIMDAADLAKIELPEVTLSIRNVAPSVVITDEDNLPDIACKFERKPDKTKIKELLATGLVAGAAMTNGGKTLSIRIK
jgi:sugar-specific transcriptional regulator TrmB